MKLLVISMVANNFLGLANNFKASSPFDSLDFSSSSKAVFDKEKKATSVPEIIAERNSKPIKTTISNTRYHGTEFKNVIMGSGSNFIFKI